MTYCVGILVDEGLVLASDTRTSASFDDVRTYAKTHRFVFPGERCLVLMSAGNLGTTQAVLSRLQRDLDEGPPSTCAVRDGCLKSPNISAACWWQPRPRSIAAAGCPPSMWKRP